MKFSTKLLAAAAVFASFGVTVGAQATDEVTNASVTIQRPVTITENTALDFATVQADPAGDTVTLTPANAISSTGTSTFSGTTSVANYDVTADPSTALTISFSTGDVLTGPGTDIPLDNFQHDAGAATTDASGDLSFNVGADLTVGAAQTPGGYTGTFTLTVDY